MAQDINGLSIQLDLDGLSFVCPPSAQVQSVAFDYTTSNLEIVLDSLTQAFRRTPALTDSYAHCTAVLPTRKFTWVPRELFCEDKAKDLLNALHPLDELDEVNTYPLEAQGAVCIYALPASVTAKVIQFQKHTQFLASAIPCVQYLMAQEAPSRALLFFSCEAVHVVIAQQDRLLLSNAYPGTHSLSALYFLLLALKQWQINPQTLQLYVGGKALLPKEKAQMARYIPSLCEVPEKETILLGL